MYHIDVYVYVYVFVLHICAVSSHLDHCGALPYLTEQVGYSGPIIMTAPTRALLPLYVCTMCTSTCMAYVHVAITCLSHVHDRMSSMCGVGPWCTMRMF